MNQQAKSNQVNRNLFMGNYFCIMEEYQAAFVTVSKNAVTYLKKIVVYSKENTLPISETPHTYIGFTPDKGFLIPISEMPLYEQKHGKLLKFAVWRDPVERLISAYKCFVIEKKPRYYFYWLDLYTDSSFERFVEFTKFELGKSRVILQDEHIRKQADYYSPSDVDYIVPIEHLNHFLTKHHIPTLKERSNETQDCNLEIEDSVIKDIQKLYLKDYQLFNTADNIYQP